jgi:aminoglycoside phosphotransferase family enzyme
MTTFAAMGTVSQIRAAFDENYEQTLPASLGDLKPSSSLMKPKPIPITFLPPRGIPLPAALDQNWIRACHGDLHLNNIAYWQDQALSVRLHRVQRTLPLCGCDVRCGLCGDGFDG